MKRKLLFVLITTLLFSSCNKQTVNHFEGIGLGTQYAISYVGKTSPTLSSQVDSILQVINTTFSVFDSTSLLSQFNAGQTISLNEDFIKVFHASCLVSRATDGAFDCTIQPLTELWGFGRQNQKQIVPQAEIDSVKSYVGYQLISLINNKLVKKDPRVQLNFNAIAKGYAVDKIAHFLQQMGYQNFVVEVGGEVVSKGSKNGEAWQIGIQVPTETANGPNESNYAFPLKDKAVATSGNYRNYFEKNGVRYTHILNPATGKPEHTNVLSVSVIANTCMTADAYATAFMVLGMEKSLEIVKHTPELAVYFIYDDHGKYKTKKSPNFP